jgi:hypothetical protein
MILSIKDISGAWEWVLPVKTSPGYRRMILSIKDISGVWE